MRFRKKQSKKKLPKGFYQLLRVTLKTKKSFLYGLQLVPFTHIMMMRDKAPGVMGIPTYVAVSNQELHLFPAPERTFDIELVYTSIEVA